MPPAIGRSKSSRTASQSLVGASPVRRSASRRKRIASAEPCELPGPILHTMGGRSENEEIVLLEVHQAHAVGREIPAFSEAAVAGVRRTECLGNRSVEREGAHLRWGEHPRAQGQSGQVQSPMSRWFDAKRVLPDGACAKAIGCHHEGSLRAVAEGVSPAR